jgi:hypothetical protein
MSRGVKIAWSFLVYLALGCGMFFSQASPTFAQTTADTFTGSYKTKYDQELDIKQTGSKIKFYISVAENNGGRVGEAEGTFTLTNGTGTCKSSDNPDGTFKFTLQPDKIKVQMIGDCFASGVHGDGVYLKKSNHPKNL